MMSSCEFSGGCNWKLRPDTMNCCWWSKFQGLLILVVIVIICIRAVVVWWRGVVCWGSAICNIYKHNYQKWFPDSDMGILSNLRYFDCLFISLVKLRWKNNYQSCTLLALTVWESTGHWWIPIKKGMWYENLFHIMISSRPKLIIIR